MINTILTSHPAALLHQEQANLLLAIRELQLYKR
jgi:hypothetical protein